MLDSSGEAEENSEEQTVPRWTDSTLKKLRAFVDKRSKKTRRAAPKKRARTPKERRQAVERELAELRGAAGPATGHRRPVPAPAPQDDLTNELFGRPLYILFFCENRLPVVPFQKQIPKTYFLKTEPCAAGGRAVWYFRICRLAERKRRVLK